MKILSAMSKSDLTELLTLIHSKDHIGKPGTKFQALERKLRKPDTCRVPLFRGLDTYNAAQLKGKKVGDTIVTNTYWSASEKKSVAVGFAVGYGSRQIVEIAPNTKGFCLWKFGVADLNDLRNTNPAEYENADGDFLAESYEDEAEWIIGIGVTLEVVSMSPMGLVKKLKQVQR